MSRFKHLARYTLASIVGLSVHVSHGASERSPDDLFAAACIADIVVVGTARSSWLERVGEADCPTFDASTSLQRYHEWHTERSACYYVMVSLTVERLLIKAPTYAAPLPDTATVALPHLPNVQLRTTLGQYGSSLVGVSMIYKLADYRRPYMWHMGEPLAPEQAGSLQGYVGQKCPGRRVH